MSEEYPFHKETVKDTTDDPECVADPNDPDTWKIIVDNPGTWTTLRVNQERT